VNGEIVKCPAVLASMDHDHQLERHTNVNPVELLMEQLRQFAHVAGDARGSIEYTRCSFVCDSLQSTGKNRITVVDSRGDDGTNECRC